MRKFYIAISTLLVFNSCQNYGVLTVVDAKNNPLQSVSIAPSDMLRGKKYSSTDHQGKVKLTIDINQYQLNKHGYQSFVAKRTDANWPIYKMKEVIPQP